MAKDKLGKGHPNFRAAVAQIVFEIRQDLKAGDTDSLVNLGEALIKAAKEEAAFRNKATPTIDRLSAGKGRPSR